MRRCTRLCRGTSVAEALVALILGLLLLTVSLSLVARQRGAQAALAQRMGFLDTARVLRHVVGRELRATWGPPDVALHPPDSIALRAYRGFARVCTLLSRNRVLAAAEGSRMPDPTKDSVVFLTSGGGAYGVALVSVEDAGGRGCGVRPGRRLVLSVSDSVPGDAFLARYFERGSYHLSGGALRYRRGRSGRQPLTPESLRTPPSAFAPGVGDGIVVELLPRRPPARAWRISLRRGIP